MPVSRVVVNTSTTRGALGLSTALSPSLTLGCVWRDKNVTYGLTYGQRSPAAPDGYKAHRLRDPTIEGITPAPIDATREPEMAARGNSSHPIYRFDGPRFRELACNGHAGNRELFRIGF